MLLLYRLRILKFDIALILIITTVHPTSVQSHVCMFVKRPDPSRGGILRWSLPKEEMCLCQAVVAPTNIGSSCPIRDKYEAGDLWFVDDPRPLTKRSNWRADKLDGLLQRIEFCANECTLKIDNCDINAVCKDIPGSFTCTCNAGYAGDGTICLDIEKPEWESCPSNITEHTDPGLPTAAVIWTTPTAHDNSEIVHVSCNYGAGSNKFYFKIGDAVVECSAVDESGNKNVCYFTVSVVDIENPLIIACPADLVIPTDPSNPTAVVTYQAPDATDNSGQLNVTCDPKSESEFAIGPNNVVCTAHDGSKNSATCEFTVDVKDEEDPMIGACPADLEMPTDPGYPNAIVTYQVPDATDNSGEVIVTCDPPSESEFAIGPNNVVCTAQDGSENSVTCEFTVDVKDEEIPSISACPEDIGRSTELDDSTVEVTYQPPTAADNSGEMISVTCTPPSGTEFAIGQTNVTCTSQDSSGNIAACGFEVDVKDEEDPLIGACPADLQMPTDLGNDTAEVTFQPPTATDNSGEAFLTCTPPSGTEFAIGLNTVTCTARDGSGNTATCEFEVDVKGPCNQLLGVEDGRINDNQLTASSEYPNTTRYHGVTNARLNRPAQEGTAGAWCAGVKDDNQWIQASLGDQRWVTGVLLQGQQDYPQWVTKYKVQYSDDGINWSSVLQEDNQEEFSGNADQTTVVASHFPWPVKASFIRIQPIEWYGNVCLRFELLGCEVHCSDEADWVTFGDHQYCFVHAPDVSYTQAEAECEIAGAKLASIHSQEEHNFIAANTMDISLISHKWWGYWIGLNDRHDEGTFVWTDGTETNYLNWYPNEPNYGPGSGYCVVVMPRNNYSWNDDKCNLAARAYICKKQT